MHPSWWGIPFLNTATIEDPGSELWAVVFITRSEFQISIWIAMLILTVSICYTEVLNEDVPCPLISPNLCLFISTGHLDYFSWSPLNFIWILLSTKIDTSVNLFLYLPQVLGTYCMWSKAIVCPLVPQTLEGFWSSHFPNTSWSIRSPALVFHRVSRSSSGNVWLSCHYTWYNNTPK